MLDHAPVQSRVVSVEEKWAAALDDGSALIVTDEIFAKEFRTPTEIPRHALPENRTSELAFWFDSDGTPGTCNRVLDNVGNVLQTSKYDHPAGELITSFSSGDTHRRTKYAAYDLGKMRGILLSQPQVLPDEHADSSTDLFGRQSQAVVDQTSPDSRRIAYYDAQTGERFATERWDTTLSEAPVLLYRLVRTVEIVPVGARTLDLCKDLPAQGSPLQAPAPDGPETAAAEFSIDTDPSAPGTQTTRTVAVGDSFNVEIVTTTSLPWEGYQITLHYDDVVLDGVVPNPDQPWTAAPIEGGRGGNRFAFTTTPAFCTPSTHGPSRNLEDDAGLANWAMTCSESASGTSHTGSGALVQFTFKCEAPGAANLTLADVNDTFLLSSDFTQYNDQQSSAAIACV